MDDLTTVKVGVIIRFSDEQAILSSMESGQGVTSDEYEVNWKRSITAYDSTFRKSLPIRWTLLGLTNTKNESILLYVRRILGEKIDSDDIGLFYYPMGATSVMTRERLIAEDIKWLFDAPEKDDWKPCDLDYAIYPAVPPIQEGEKEVCAEFKMKDPGIMFGLILPEQLAGAYMITEYSTESEIQNPRMLVIEESFLKTDGKLLDSGGFVSVLLGCSIRLSDVDVLG
jgi:hypothetical protein